jgi:hypothetical protein
MAVFELVLFLLLVGVGLTLLAPRLGMPGPVLLAVAGVGLAFIPGVPVVVLDPKLALVTGNPNVCRITRLFDKAYGSSGPTSVRCRTAFHASLWRP